VQQLALIKELIEIESELDYIVRYESIAVFEVAVNKCD